MRRGKTTPPDGHTLTMRCPHCSAYLTLEAEAAQRMGYDPVRMTCF